jgi:multidrug efflux pump
VTLFGLMLTPVFYVLLRKLAGGKHLADKHGHHPHIHGPDDSPSAPAVRVPEPAYED